MERAPSVPVEERPYATTVCPYCAAPFAKLPKAKSKCKTCGRPVYVRSGADGRRHLLREEDEGHWSWDLSQVVEEGEESEEEDDDWEAEEAAEREALARAGFLTGDNDVEVVGESHYKPALRRLWKRGDEAFVARLVREPANKYDENAIRVEIEGEQVGHINRDDAEEMQDFMKGLERQGRPAWVRAELKGGSDGRYIGVELDGLPDYF